MYRVLVVDNEAYVVESVIFYIEEQCLDQVEVYGCYSAAEALDRMERMRVDILLTDIRMPGMDGLQLQEQVVARWPQCKTIFLTGYDDFGYIQRAYRTGGCGYLLKSEGKGAVVGAVRQACQALDAQAAQEVLLSQAKERYEAALPALRQQLLRKLLSAAAPEERQRQEAFEQVRLGLDGGERVFLLLAHNDRAAAQDAWQNEWAMSQVCSLLLQRMPDTLRCDGIAYGDMAAWLLQPGAAALGAAEPWRRARLQISENLQAVQEMCQQHLSISLSLILSAQPSPWEGLYALRKRMETRLHMHLLDGALLLEPEANALPLATVDARVCQILDKAKLLYAYLDTGNRADFMGLFDTLVKAVNEAADPARGDLRLELLSRVGSMFLSQLNRWSMAEELAQNQDLQPLRQALFTLPWAEALRYLKALAEAFFRMKNQRTASQEDSLVAQLHHLVAQNLGGDLSLPHLGDMMGMNPYYMARLYQAHTGKRLVNYIAELRIARAKELLEKDVLTSRDVGKVVGYGSAQAFHRFFKKMTGMTPQEYKNNAKIGHA